MEGIMKVTGDQCCYGLKSRDKQGEGLVRKTTGFMTNAPCIALQLQRKCPNRSGKVHHRHVTLEGGRTKPAQVYPEGLCRAICQGLIHQLEVDKKGQFMLARLAGTKTALREGRTYLGEASAAVCARHSRLGPSGPFW